MFEEPTGYRNKIELDTATIYVFHDRDDPSPEGEGYAEVYMKGRFPGPKGKAFVNNVVEELIEILETAEGAAIYINGERHGVRKGFKIRVKPGDKIYFIGEIYFSTTSTPPFYAEQNEIVDVDF